MQWADCPVVIPFRREVLGKLGKWLFLPPGVTKAQFGLLVSCSMTAARVVLRKWKKTKKQPRIH